MKNDDNNVSNQIIDNTTTISFKDDTYNYKINDPFQKMGIKKVDQPSINKGQPGRNTIHTPSSKIGGLNKKNNNNSKFFFFGKSKNKPSQNKQANDNDNMENIMNNKINETKKVKNKKLIKTNTINFISPANEFQKTTLEKNNLIEDSMDNNFGITLKPLNEQWKFQKILLDYNILDFTSKYYY